MQRIELSHQQGFHVVARTARSQAATMRIAPGESVGSAQNRHERSDQWLLVRSGRGHATVNDEAFDLTPGTLLLIEAGDRHRIENDGSEPLDTLNVYAPPAY